MLTLQINGQSRDLNLTPSATLDQVLQDLNLKADRVAVEHNGNIIARYAWPTTKLSSGDRLEIVHFVGGGLEGGSSTQSSRKTQRRSHYTEYVLSDVG